MFLILDGARCRIKPPTRGFSLVVISAPDDLDARKRHAPVAASAPPALTEARIWTASLLYWRASIIFHPLPEGSRKAASTVP